MTERRAAAPCLSFCAGSLLRPRPICLAHLLRYFAWRDATIGYANVAEAGLDPLEHYMVQGFRESRRPFAAFDPAFYRQRYLHGEVEANPLLHYLANRDRPGVHPSLPAGETTVAREVRRHTQPGPCFETRRPLPETASRRARVLAYYLPQFHAVPRNDEWWGEGFTEWTNVQRGLPRFAGHYQPRVPRDLGHYRLEGTETLKRQAEMARAAGIEASCSISAGSTASR